MTFLSSAHRQGYSQGNSQGEQTASNTKLKTSAASIAACQAAENQAPVGKGMSVATVKKASLSRSAQASSCKEHHGNFVVSLLDDLNFKGCPARLAVLLTGSLLQLQPI